jgi:precorrin-6Y C5,15-methyltransferase (decarboxylating)
MLLCELKFPETRMTVLETLGGAHERIRSTSAREFSLVDVDRLNTVALEVVPDPTAMILPRTSGLPDDCFEHDGQLTKREVRTLSLSALAPRRHEILWDIGAGAGSIAIEWMLADKTLSAIAIESSPDRVLRIRRNARNLGVPQLSVVAGRAPEAFADLPRPNAIFIGGGVGTPGLIEKTQAALLTGGRLVANAVSLAGESYLLKCHRASGGALTRIALSRADQLGESVEVMGWRPLMPVTQWTWTKP